MTAHSMTLSEYEAQTPADRMSHRLIATAEVINATELGVLSPEESVNDMAILPDLEMKELVAGIAESVSVRGKINPAKRMRARRLAKMAPTDWLINAEDVSPALVGAPLRHPFVVFCRLGSEATGPQQPLLRGIQASYVRTLSNIFGGIRHSPYETTVGANKILIEKVEFSETSTLGKDGLFERKRN